MAVAKRIRTQEQLCGFLGSAQGKQLLKAHSLRRALDPTQRANEWGASYPVEVHVLGRHGFGKPSGQLSVHSGELRVAFSSHADTSNQVSTVRRVALLKFANALANRCGLALRVEQ